MLRKQIAILLTCILIAGMLIGCAHQQTTASGPSGSRARPSSGPKPLPRPTP